MMTRKDLKFNCAERTIIGVNESRAIPGFSPVILRIASNFGGGIAGWGSTCGAVSGAIMALGMSYGTDGTETVEAFTRKRAHLRSISQEFLDAFERQFGSVTCSSLICTDLKSEVGRMKYELLKRNGRLNCEEYVEWATTYITKLIHQTEKSVFDDG